MMAPLSREISVKETVAVNGLFRCNHILPADTSIASETTAQPV